VYRVEIDGRFPARDSRYVISVDGRPAAYGLPSPHQRSVLGVTDDPAVLGGDLSVSPGPTRSDGEPSRAGIRAPAPADAPEVGRAAYNFGDASLRLPSLRRKVEFRANVHYPKGPGGPYPLVLFIHGNHSTCSRGQNALYMWPCRTGDKPIPNFKGYDYLATELAGHGYVVVSVSTNGVNVFGNRFEDTGMRQRGELLEAHVRRWRRWATTGGEPFGDRFVGKVDLSRIGVMGHSRGGEGALWQVIVDRERPTPFGIDAVLALAPVDFSRVVVNHVPLAVVLPYCDGDVFDLQGMHFFDDARYAVPGDPSPKHTVTVFGANHNFFNTVWTPGEGFPGGFDDGVRPCAGRLTAPHQRTIGAAYMVGFFRRYLGGETSLDPIWTGADQPPSIPPRRAIVTYLAPDTAPRRLDLLRFTGAESLSTNALGGAVTSQGFSRVAWCADIDDDPCLPGLYFGQDVHHPALARGKLSWSAKGAELSTELPMGSRDISGFMALQLRAALDPTSDLNAGVEKQGMKVIITDGDGHRAAALAADVNDEALAFPRGISKGVGHVILQQIRFPLSRFAARGVDLTRVHSIAFRFPTPRGRVVVSDVALSRGIA
jgi:dienelactone hydrolase